ncbi:MAG: GNAT family N-acetyltransferase [Sphingomonas sp.]
MTKPLRLADFDRLPSALRVTAVDGLASALDRAAEAAPATHRFLRYQWYAAALGAYGGAARTVLVEREGRAVAALPFIGFGPDWLRLASVPGCYWPFRSFPADARADDAVFTALADGLAGEVRALRIGPVYDDDAATQGLIAAMRRRGWAVLDRFIADSFLFDMSAERDAGTWPRNSTLRKNRFHEKHLAEHGALDWQFLNGSMLAAGGFDALAEIEDKSWIVARTDGSDAKFTLTGHGAFWRAAASDPVIGAMLHAALLCVEGAPAAFSFDINAGALKYAIANSYDPAFAKHSPGKLLYYRNLVAALGSGITRVDWGAGDSGYKSVIGASKGPAIRDWLLLRPGLPAFAGRLLKGLWSRSGQG